MSLLQLNAVKLRNIPGPFTVRPKRHFLSSLAGRSANIAAELFLLVSVHTSLTTAASLPDMERDAQPVRPPMAGTPLRHTCAIHSDLSNGTGRPALCVLSALSDQSVWFVGEEVHKKK